MGVIKFHKRDIDTKNLTSPSTWIAGQTSATGFSRNGTSTENLLINGKDPFGNSTVIWEAYNTDVASNDDGGWDSTSFSIDKTKLYRFSVWINRKIMGSNGYMYWGTNGYGTTNGVYNRSNGTTLNTNPYFYVPNYNTLPIDEWVLIVGHIWPAGSGAGSQHSNSGRYTVRNGKIGNISEDYIWHSTTTSSNHRAYLYYCTDPSVIVHFVYPRVDVVDGTEPSINDLLHGFGSSNNVENALIRKDFVLGGNTVNYGPTKDTGNYASLPIPSGGYTVYQKYGNNMRGWAPNNDAELLRVVRTLGGDYSNITNALLWITTQNDIIIQSHEIQNIVTDKLALYLDVSNVNSYPKSGNTWYDMSGNNNHCIFSSTPTYNNTYLTFNGSNYGTITNNSTLDFSNSQTLLMVLRHNYTSGRRNPWDQAYGGYGTWTHENGENISQYFGDAGTDAPPYVGISSATTPRNVWNFICATRDTTQHKWYLNTSLTNTQSHSYGTLATTTANIRIGTGYAGGWVGDMGVVLAYTKVLTIDEITQNYNALKSRFGV